MRYKVGDKVKIKTWEEMEKEFGLDYQQCIRSCFYRYTPSMEKELTKLNTNRIITIKEIFGEQTTIHYRAEEISYNLFWTNNMIECLANEIEPGSTPILSRFEILDL